MRSARGGGNPSAATRLRHEFPPSAATRLLIALHSIPLPVEAPGHQKVTIMPMDTKTSPQEELRPPVSDATGDFPAMAEGGEEHLLILRGGESNLKGGNRRRFFSQLERNVRRALHDLPAGAPRRLTGRIVVPLSGAECWPEIRQRVAKLYGIENFSLGHPAHRSLEGICQTIERHWPHGMQGSFLVRCRRGDKKFPLKSPQIEREVGGFIHQKWGLPVDLRNPETTIRVEILPNVAYVSFGILQGAGGLPTGTSGRLVVLFSGGIDSPVAAARLQRRGVTVELVHFSGRPFQDRRSERKAKKLARVLARSQMRLNLWLVPFGEVQRRIVVASRPALRVLLYRRLMLRIARKLAWKCDAPAVATGGSMGQVASQTLQNLVAIDDAVQGPVFRPLIGMDKQEIIDEARKLGTYDISILPDGDCCQLFAPKKGSELAVTIAEIRRAEEGLDIEDLVMIALAGATVERFRLPGAASD